MTPTSPRQPATAEPSTGHPATGHPATGHPATGHPGGSGPEGSAASGSEGAAGRHRLRRDAEENRQQILAAAGRLMAERGLATPLGDIAAAAGVGIGTLYRRFPARDDLVEALFEDRLAAYLADLEEALSIPDGWNAFVWYLRHSTAREVADRALSELLDLELPPGAVRRLKERVIPLGEALLERAKASGRLRPDITITDIVLIKHMLGSVGTLLGGVDDTAWERYLDIAIDGLVASREGPSRPSRPALALEELKATHSERRTRTARSPKSSG